MNNIIAFGGLKGVGKDTSAKMFRYITSVPKHFRKYWLYKILDPLLLSHKYKLTSFAHSLKKTLSAMLDIPIENFEDRYFKEKTFINFNGVIIKDEYFLDPEDKISDKSLNKYLKNKDFSFIQNKWISFRQLLQIFGTNICRDILGEKLWIYLTFKHIHNQNYLITDLRFKDEYDSVINYGGTVIYVDRKAVSPGSHRSEKEIIDMYNNNVFENILDNNGTLKDLFYNIVKYVEK